MGGMSYGWDMSPTEIEITPAFSGKHVTDNKPYPAGKVTDFEAVTFVQQQGE